LTGDELDALVTAIRGDIEEYGATPERVALVRRLTDLLNESRGNVRD
jgi:hypothetical protein